MTEAVRKGFSMEQALAVADEIGLDFASAPFDAEQFRRGMEVELEHGRRDPVTDVTQDDPIITGQDRLGASARDAGLLRAARRDGTRGRGPVTPPRRVRGPVPPSA